MLEKQDEELIAEARLQLNGFVFPQAAGEEIRLEVAAGHPAVPETLQEIIGQMEKDYAALEDEIRVKTDDQKKLEEEKTRGEALNGLLADLDRKRAQLSGAREQKEDMEALRELIGRAEAAERLIPAEEAMNQAEKEWDGVREKIRSLEEDKARLKKKAGELETRLEAMERENRPVMEAWEEQQARIRNVLPFYDEKEKSDRVYRERIAEAEKAARKAKALGKELEKKKERQEEIALELKRLEPAGEAAAAVASRSVRDLSLRLTVLENMKTLVRDVQRFQEEEERLAAELGAAREAGLAAEEEHLRLNRAFLEGQAGLLARDMRRKLETEGVVRCPVCGTIHTGPETASFAEYREDIPTKDRVDAAMEAWNTAREAEKQAELSHSRKAQECRSRQQELNGKAKELLCLAEWEDPAGSMVLEEAIRSCRSQLDDARKAYDQAVKDKEDKDQAVLEKKKTDVEAAGLALALDEARRTAGRAETEAAAARAGVEHWQKQLDGFPESKRETRLRLDELDEELGKCRSQIEQAKKQVEECRNAQASNEGKLAGAFSERESRRKEWETAVRIFETGLKKYSFADEETYQEALSPEGERLTREALSRWISRKREVVGNYDKNCGELGAAIRQLEESVKGQKRVDLETMEAGIREASAILKDLKKKENRMGADLQIDRRICTRLNEIRARQKRLCRAMEKLKPLSETANGSYAFCRYVLSGFFHNIVGQANIHLETMTDGEYCLVPKETGDGRKNIGLELKVLNTITGLERETATLSGGQLFEASLALALGLSDVVQMESTSTIRIDSMFIDEGFGSLDGGRLDKAIEVLRHLSAGRRQIGIISHVARLDECLPRQIHVIAGERGSTVKIETDV